MSRDELSPAAIIQAQASLRIYKGEARGLNQRISEAETKHLGEYLELGKKLRQMRPLVKHGEWEPLLDDLHIPSQRASEAIAVAEFWWKFGDQAKSVSQFLALKASYKGRLQQSRISDSTQTEAGHGDGNYEQIPGGPGIWATPQNAAAESGDQPGQNDGQEAVSGNPLPVSGDGGNQLIGSQAPDIGDAAEELPPGTVLDPEGHALPQTAVSAFQHAEKAAAVANGLRSVAGLLRELEGLPDGAATFFRDPEEGVPGVIKVVEKLLRSGWRMIDNHTLRPDNAFACDGYAQHGCAGAGCSKCKGLGVVPKPLYGEKPPPKPRPPFRGRRP